MVKAIVGANWGDEGKGKITDFFAKEADFTVRFQGGANAGHTIINNKGKFALHQLPSGVFYNNVTNIISNGCALNIESLLDELHRLESSDINCNLMISNRVQILLEHHILIDKLEEQRLADRAFGSTKSGIAPFYAEKYSKTGLQLWELYDINLKERLKQIYDKINNIIKSTYNADKIDYVKVYDKLSQLSQKILPYVKDTTKVLKEAIKQNKHILLEGQLGSLKDIDHGIYPYVTSSSTLAGYACTGAGISPIDISEILAVTKAYSSAVGEGPFVSEIFGNEADQLRARGGDAGEYGTTTNRPRRVGYFDAIASKYGVNIQGANKIAITCLDVLAYMDKIPVCVAYDIEGNKTLDFPTTNLLYKAKPVYEYLQGFGNIRDVTDYNDLPNAAKEYVAFIEDFIGVKVSLISTGPSRDAIIEI